MRLIFSSRWFLLAVLLVMSISTFSFVAYKKAGTIYANSQESCKKAEANQPGEMLWDVIARQFVSSVSIH